MTVLNTTEFKNTLNAATLSHLTRNGMTDQDIAREVAATNVEVAPYAGNPINRATLKDFASAIALDRLKGRILGEYSGYSSGQLKALLTAQFS